MNDIKTIAFDCCRYYDDIIIKKHLIQIQIFKYKRHKNVLSYAKKLLIYGFNFPLFLFKYWEYNYHLIFLDMLVTLAVA